MKSRPSDAARTAASCELSAGSGVRRSRGRRRRSISSGAMEGLLRSVSPYVSSDPSMR